jgi:hypothetical protein
MVTRLWSGALPAAPKPILRRATIRERPEPPPEICESEPLRPRRQPFANPSGCEGRLITVLQQEVRKLPKQAGLEEDLRKIGRKLSRGEKTVLQNQGFTRREKAQFANHDPERLSGGFARPQEHGNSLKAKHLSARLPHRYPFGASRMARFAKFRPACKPLAFSTTSALYLSRTTGKPLNLRSVGRPASLWSD